MKNKLYFIKDWVPLYRKAHWHASELPQLVGSSGRTVRRIFSKLFGSPPQHVMDWSRGEEAKRMLLNGDPEKQIAEHLGFTQVPHFIRFFRRLYGKCPQQFLKELDAPGRKG